MEKHCFMAAMTPLGFYSFFDKLIDTYELTKLYILKGGSGVGKSTFMRKFANVFLNEDIDFIHCSSDPESLDGVIIVGKKVGIVDGTSPHLLDPTYPGVIDEIINLGEFIIEKNVKANKQKISDINLRKKQYYKAALDNLAKARETHLELESLYKGAVDFDGIDKVLARIISKHSEIK